MCKAVLGLMVLLTFHSQTAHAVVDPDPDQVGVYFDANADVNALSITPYVLFPAFIVVTNATRSTVDGFALRYRLEVPPGLEGLLFRLIATGGPGDDGCIVDCDSTDIYDDFFVTHFLTPVPATAATVVKAWQFMLLTDFGIEFHLEPIPAGDYGGISPAYFSGGEEIPLGVSSGSYLLPVAVVNGEGPVALQEASFGAVKALYR